MISESHKFIFVHIPKTGGNSIQSQIIRYSEDKLVSTNSLQDGVERFEVRHGNSGLRKHSTLTEYKKVLDSDFFHSAFKFCVIRNPWDRLISFYFSPHRGKQNWDKGEFIRFARKVKPVRKFIQIEGVLEKINSRLGTNLFPTNRNPLNIDLDYVLKFESLNEDYEVLCKKLNIAFNPLPVRNKSTRDHYSKYYDSQLIQLIEELFEDEIRFGNYQFEK